MDETVSLPMDALKKRALLNAKAPSSDSLINAGRGFFSLGLLMDALELYSKAGFKEGIKEVAQEALKSGDVFIYLLCFKALAEEPPKEGLKKLADNALALGKLYFAKKGYESLGLTEKAQAVGLSGLKPSHSESAH